MALSQGILVTSVRTKAVVQCERMIIKMSQTLPEKRFWENYTKPYHGTNLQIKTLCKFIFLILTLLYSVCTLFALLYIF